MKLTFIANACCIYESQGFKILCDPWLTDGAFYGAWYHYPPLETKPKDIADFDLLYISHLHPDHFDPETLKHFDKHKPVVILKSEHDYLGRMLRAQGFNNIFKLESGYAYTFGHFQLTMFKPFVKHPFFDCELGNIIDSALVVDDGKHKILNCNDNTPDLESARLLKERFEQFDVAQINYNAAGPYPSCFNVNRKTEHEAILKRNLDHMVGLAQILQPQYLMPFAGDFALGGENWEKNTVLGTTFQATACLYSWAKGQKALCFNEGDSLDLVLDRDPTNTFTLHGNPRTEYIRDILSQKPYAYESDSLPSQPEMDCLMREARDKLYAHQERLNCFPNCTVHINNRYTILMNKGEPKDAVDLECELDPALLYGIITRKYHWNNAEIGCHIEFKREPNIYQPDVHTLLSFLHV